MIDEEKVIDIDFNKKFELWGKRLGQFIIGIVLILIAIVMIFNAIYKLETGNVGVITRFGEIKKVNELPGIHVKLPFIDKLEIVDIQTVHKIEYGYRTSRSGDTAGSPEYMSHEEEERVIIQAQKDNASIILLELVVRFQIEDPVNYLYYVDDLEGTMHLVIEDVVRSTLPSFTINDALEHKELLDEAIMPKIQKKLDRYQSGIKIVQVATQNVSLLPSVEETRQKVEEANQYKQGKEEEAEKYKNTVIPKAEAEATKLYEDARGYSATVVANAKADVAEFEALYSEYIQNPEVIKERVYIEAMQNLIQNNNLVIDYTNQESLLKFYNATQ